MTSHVGTPRAAAPTARRNALVAMATGLTLAGLIAYPQSLNRAGAQRKPGQALAAAGVVASSAGTAAGTVVNGTSVDTRYGLVQVQISVTAGRVTSARAIDYPRSGSRDRQLSAYAVPILQRETVSVQTASIDTVSGATFTSEGYRTSLQAALDAAHLP